MCLEEVAFELTIEEEDVLGVKQNAILCNRG